MGGNDFKVIDLFCGSGGVTEGLKSEGFKVLAAVDNDPVSCNTYRMNHPEVHLFESDIGNLLPENVNSKIGLAGNLDLLVVCAPCQPFSSQNRKRSGKDPRAGLILESIKFVKFFKPRLIFYENVPGIAVAGPTQILRDELNDLGYLLGQPLKIDAADCGVPQRRERCIMLSACEPKVVKSFHETIRFKPRVTVREAIGELDTLGSGQKDPIDPLHFARRHKQIVLERLRCIPPDGGSRSALPESLELRCHKGRINDFPDVYGRMRWDDVAPTLTTGCTDVTKGRFAHPDDDRAISLREAALLQSFPMHYKFSGNSGQIARQIGNAVPVNMIRTMAPSFIKSLKTIRRIEQQRNTRIDK